VWAYIGPVRTIPVRTTAGLRNLRAGPEIHYWVPTDYTAVDLHRETEEGFRQLVEEAHRLVLKFKPLGFYPPKYRQRRPQGPTRPERRTVAK